MEEKFLAGAATVEITPAAGLLMDGYVARNGTSTGTHDPLSAAALVLEYEDRRAAIVTLDVMAVSRSFTEPLRHDLAAKLGTSPDSIMICASHTHAAPRGLQDWSPIGAAALDRQLAASVYANIQQIVEQAHDRMRLVRLRSAVGEIQGIGGDRNRPERAVETRVAVLAFEDENDEPEAVLFHYACHPTVLGAENREYSADLPGAVRQLIHERYPNAVCLYVNGAAGNISTRFQRRNQSFDEVERLGRLLGERVVELTAAASYDAPALRWTCETLPLPLRVFPVEARRIAATGYVRIDTVKAQGAAIEAKLRHALHGRESQPAEICALKIGSWAIVSVPGEAFDDLAAALRSASAKALVAGYTNDYLGYFPTQAAIDDATYEALSSAFDARAHSLLQEQLIGLIRRMQTG